MLKTKKLWIFPWSFKESFLIAALLLISSVLIQLTTSTSSPVIEFPYNLIALFSFAGIIVILHIFRKRSNLIRWLSGTHAAVSAIVLFGILAIGMGLIPQYRNTVPGDILHNIVNSWTYFIALTFLLLVLGLTVLRRKPSFSFMYIGFILNHLGFWIFLAASSLGYADMQRLRMQTNIGKAEWIAFYENRKPVELDIAIELLDFNVEFLTPSLILFDKEKENPIHDVKPLYITKETKNGNIGDLQIEITQFMEESMPFDSGFKQYMGPGAVTSAHIIVKKNDQYIQGWVSTSSKYLRNYAIELPDKQVLILKHGEAKNYVSYLKTYTKSGIIRTDSLFVNSPITINGYKIYQVSYDKDLGKYSDISVIELIKDPWLPYVYAGITMLIVGALIMFYLGTYQKRQNE